MAANVTGYGQTGKNFSVLRPKALLTKLPLNQLRSKERLAAENTGEAAGRLSMQHILYADTFVNNSIDVGNDRLNTILNETFQLTVRQRIYEEEEELEDLDLSHADFAIKIQPDPWHADRPVLHPVENRTQITKQ